MIEHRFRTAETSGTVRLLEDRVETTVRRNLSRWTYEIPYRRLDPYPLRMWTTSTSFWVCLGVGALGVGGAASELVGAEGRHMPPWMPPVVLLGAIGLLWFAFIHRREEWVIFSSASDTRVRYCRNGPDADSISQFTDSLIAEIKDHQLRDGGEPHNAREPSTGGTLRH